MKQFLFNNYTKYKFSLAKKAFEGAKPSPYFLKKADLNNLFSKYLKVEAKPFQDYTVTAMRTQALDRKDLLLNYTKNKPNKILEIGAGAGFVLEAFKNSGCDRCISVDIIDQLYPEVKNAGVELCLTSAEDMTLLNSEFFDLIYSWGTLEHIPNPKLVINESLRLLSPGGVLHFEFGPLYYSPWGYHHQATIRLPYAHILFPEDFIHEIGHKKYGADYNLWLPQTNGLGFNSYQEILNQLPPDCKIIGINQGYDWFSSDLIIKYPEVFKAKGVPFENFFIDTISWTIKKAPIY